MQTLTTPHLVLEPLGVAHAEEMFALLREPALYTYLDYGPPASLDHLRYNYAMVEAHESSGETTSFGERWLNWVARPTSGDPGQAQGGSAQAPVGYVQATISVPGIAWIGYVFAQPHWGRGHAHAATQAMIEHLAEHYAVRRCLATVEAENHRSIRLMARLGFREATAEEASGHTLSATERLFVLELPKHNMPAPDPSAPSASDPSASDNFTR
ncbi:hypothetical protein BH11PSE9_BH11PSE9_26190 [soil metagenome]